MTLPLPPAAAHSLPDVRAVIPAIRWGIDTYFAGNPRASSFRTACDHVGAITAAAADTHPALHTVARYLEAALAALRQNRLPAGEMTRVVIQHNVDLLQTSLDAVPPLTELQEQLRSELDLTYQSLQQHLRRTAPAPRRRVTAPLPNLEATFALEAAEHISAMTALLEALEKGPTHQPGLLALRRRAHTLQGAAAMMGRPDIVRILQHMESLLAEPDGGAARARGRHLDLFFQSVDALAVLTRRPDADDVTLEICEAVFALYEVTLGDDRLPRVSQAGGGGVLPAPTADPPLLSALESQLRLPLDQFAALIDRIDQLAAPAEQAARHLAAARGAGDEAARQTHLADAEAALQAQNALRQGLRRRLQQLRLLPFDRLADRLRRLVRTAARSVNRSVTLTIEGGALAVDAPTLQALIVPLQHLLHNAIFHGIEPAEVRERAGKPPEGRITVSARQQAGAVVVTVSDDGRGLDAPRLRECVVARGLLNESAAATLALEELIPFLFAPGVTTVNRVAPLAGRGLGLNIVHRRLAERGGSVTVDSAPETGTRFTLTLPAALIAPPLLRLRSGGMAYGLPAGAVLATGRLPADTPAAPRLPAGIRHGGQTIPAVPLAALLPGTPPSAHPRAYVLLGDRQGRRALLVDDVEEAGVIPLHTPDPFLARLPLVAGLALPDNGSVLPVLDPEQLLRRPLPERAPDPTADAADALRVLVVDDSLSVRHINAAMLRRAGSEPLVARDGDEALDLLQRAHSDIDIALVDIDLPTMDGFALAAAMRATPAGAALPIIFISASDSPQQRTRIAAIPRTDFLTKPYQHQALLERMRLLLTDSDD